MSLVAAPRSGFQQVQNVQMKHMNVFFRFVDGQVSAPQLEYADDGRIISICFLRSYISLFFVDALSLAGSRYGYCIDQGRSRRSQAQDTRGGKPGLGKSRSLFDLERKAPFRGGDIERLRVFKRNYLCFVPKQRRLLHGLV